MYFATKSWFGIFARFHLLHSMATPIENERCQAIRALKRIWTVKQMFPIYFRFGALFPLTTNSRTNAPAYIGGERGWTESGLNNKFKRYRYGLIILYLIMAENVKPQKKQNERQRKKHCFALIWLICCIWHNLLESFSFFSLQ